MSAGSGIVPSSETLALVEELRKKSSKFRFATFKIDKTAVVPDRKFPDSESEHQICATYAATDEALATNFELQIYPHLLSSFEKADGPRFAVVDFAFYNKEGSIKKILAVISFCNDKTSPARVKMTFASTRTAFENKINIGKKYGANDFSELEFSTVKQELAERI